ncbi:fructosamine kinase family protein [Frigoribacterium sp. Leaf172]|uniref:fructosamine kinase family protein n=1 Tax=Frigoribacterium sp. Leaf172 TaxID=1736285 RepID=UPI0006FF1D7A|nr:fructosamine kinase family protein [Frigoribacterium sp. Leaf172]KQR64803.1 fructosamine kinase [Frigoribacterium sp. Leaf172]
MSLHSKQRVDAPPGFFEAEAAGLGWLAAAESRGGARIVGLHAVSPGRIDLEAVSTARPTAEAARRFGAALAVTHATGADAFGAPPEGYDGPCFIGRRPMSVRPAPTWGAFSAEQRVLPYAVAALDAGNLDRSGLDVVERACALLAEGVFDDDEPPARLHGDLWSGNVLFGAGGVVLIDPAAHGGHRESDLAMLALFGCPFLDDVLGAYDERAPLRDGWRDRVAVHQLHPLAVHAAGHGPGYGAALVSAADETLRLGYDLRGAARAR